LLAGTLKEGWGEQMTLDIENFDALRDYLTARGTVKSGGAMSFTNLCGGVSNRTVKVTWADGQAWVLKQALAKLRVQVDWFSSPERIGVEARALRRLNQLAPAGSTPCFIFEDMANHLMGMEAIPEEHENWKSVLLSRQIVSGHFEQFGALVGAIHRKSSEAGPELRNEFSDTTYFESLRLEPYYLYTAQTVAKAATFLKFLAKETLLHKNSLVHGDFSPKNTLIHEGRLILLDYEVVHFGDPAFDIGFAMAHFFSKAHHLYQERGRLASAAELFWQVYREEIDRLDWAATLEPRVVQHTLGCLLARVAGKSRLEYLTPEEATRQLEIVLELISTPPKNVSDLIDQFVHKIETYANN
jgi:5-methylthioribose kinase